MKSNCSSIELIVLFLCISFINAAVINLKQGDACATMCSGKDAIFKYEENKIYTYDFLSKHSIKNPNAKEETLQLELKGKAQVSKISACDYGLLLSNVQLKESLVEKSSISKEYGMMKKLLEKYPIRFGFDDGRITGVCQDNMDNDFAVNIKRGILSSLQVSIESLDTPNYLTETDIAGDCITEYTTKSEPPNFVIITKKKSIAGCSRKSKYFTTISGRAYDKPKESRNLALLDATYSCEIKVKRSEGLKESICQESHIFKPFVSETEGSKIVIIQELKFDSIKDGKIGAKIPTTRSDLTMNHGDKTPLFMKGKPGNPKVIVQEVCQTMKETITSSKITESFLRLIRSMGEATYEEIQSLNKFIADDAVCSPNKVKISNLLLDALSNVKTDAAFKFLVEDAKIYKLSKLGLSIFENPTSTMISTLAKKLDDSKSYNSVTTILSSMIKSFCQNTQGCMLNPDIIQAMSTMTKNIGSNCESSDPKVRSKILYTLRALGNAGSHPSYDKLITTLTSCVLLKSNDDDMKVYSIQTVRQFPCDENVDKFLWTIFDDVSLSSEVRIEAYISLVRCPTRGTYSQIIQKLDNEQSQQLGSFVWSHISNLMETADRFNTDIRDMLQIFTKPMNELGKKFNLDFRSYSKNIEKTYQRGFSAAKIDANIIFSTSPIPSSISINTTIDIFGRSINLFEMGIRGKGISESIFGDKAKPREHENTHPDVVKMHKKIAKAEDKLSVSLYTKFLGREIFFSPNIISDLTSALMNLSPNPSFERSLLLLDTTVSVASISGFPVELQIESGASMNFNMMRNSKPTLSDIEISTKSNYGVQISGRLLVNAHCTKIGVQSKGIISKDVEFGGKLKLKSTLSDDKNLNIDNYQFEMTTMPDNSKLFTISNELSLIHKLEKVEKIEKYETRLEKCTGEGIMKIMGMKMCISFKEAPKFSSFFPNTKVEVTMEKFSGFKMQLNRELTLKPVRKLKALLITTSFQGAAEDSFRLKIERDSKRQLYEILLWQKMVYLKFEITDKKISGELKSGKTEATLSGVLSNKGMLNMEMDVDIKSDTTTGKLYFLQKFTKEGPEITLKITKNGENGFNLQSKTSVRLTKHKVFNTFERLRHSTNFKYSGDNEMSFVLENSKGNKPANEIKSKVEIFWKTKTKRNFYVNQNYLWQKLPDDDTSELFGKIPGMKCVVNLDHQFEVNEKKFNVTNNLEYFISKKAFSNFENPTLFAVTFKREDINKKEILFEASSRFGLDFSNMGNGKFLYEHLLNYPAQKIKRELKSKVMWKLNQLQMFDINAELRCAKMFGLSFNHKFTSTQNGKTSAEVKFGDSSYAITSVFNLPKSHLLTVTWPDNILNIDSEVDAKGVNPFDVVVTHYLKMNTILIAKIINSAKYYSERKELSISSIGSTSKDKELYNIDFNRKVDYDISGKKIFYDYASTMNIKIPGLNVHKRIEIEQFAKINIDGMIKLETKTFVSKIVVQNMVEDSKPRYGYEINFENKRDTISYNEMKFVVLTGVSEDKITLKCGKEGTNALLGVSLSLKNKLEMEIMFKFKTVGNTLNSSISLLLNSKNKPEYNFYYKESIVANWEAKSSYSIKWNGEYGKEKTKNNVVLFNGLLTLHYKGWEKIDIVLTMTRPVPTIELANVNYIFNYNFEKNEAESYSKILLNSVVKWQWDGSRTASYYALQVNGNLDRKIKKIEFTLVLTKDSSLNEILSIKASGSNFETGEISVVFGKKFAKIILNIINKEMSGIESKLMVTTSNELLKELTIAMEYKKSNVLSMSYNMNLKSKKNDYKLMINRLYKNDPKDRIDFLDQLKWESNIPYIESGSNTFGILLSNKNFQCSLSLIYKAKKLIDVKIFTSDIKSNLNIMIASDIRKSIKFLSSYELRDSKFTGELDLTSDNQFFKISKLELMFKQNGKSVSLNIYIEIKTSITNFNELSLKGERNFDLENILKSYKSNSELKLNGKSISSWSIDLIKGTVSIKSALVQYIESLNVKSCELNLNYNFESIRDFMINFNTLANDELIAKLKLVYFRMKQNEKPRNIESLGDAIFYVDLDYQRKPSIAKILMFINKEKTKGVSKMQADIPQIGMKFDEVTMNFEDITGTSSMYSGGVKYKGSNYKFTYKISEGYKRDFQMIAVDKGTKPQEVMFAFDFTKDYTFKISFDEYFIINIGLMSLHGNIKSGTMKFSYKGNDIFNLKSTSKVIIPKDLLNGSDFLKAIFGIKRGMDLSFEIEGTLMKKMVKTKMQLSHLDSKLFPDGTKSLSNLDIELNDVTLQKYKFMIICDRSFPKVHFEEEMLIKIDKDVKYKRNIKMSYTSLKNIFFEGNVMKKDYELNVLSINNENVVQGNILYKMSKNKNGFGFQTKKKDFETSLHYTNELGNITVATNTGFIIKAALDSKYADIYSIGREYYIVIENSALPYKYEFRIARIKDTVVEITFGFDEPNKQMKVLIKVQDERTTKKSLSIDVKGTTSSIDFKYFGFKSKIKWPAEDNKITLTSSLSLNKNNIADLYISFMSVKGSSPYEINVDYKGLPRITGTITLDTKKRKFSHSINVSDGKYKTELWSSNSKCKMKSEFDCNFTYSNKVRDISAGIVWKKNINAMEVFWNKKKEQGFMLSCERSGSKTMVTLSSPLRTVKISRIKVSDAPNRGRKLSIVVIRKANPDKPMTFDLEYLMKGSLKTDYNMDLKLESNLMQQGIKIIINRQISTNIGDIYSLNIKSSFIGENKPFFTLEGYLRKLSARSYEMKVHATSYEKFLTLTSSVSLTMEELGIEYKILQSNIEAKEFIFQFRPFRKLKITNKRDFKILLSQTFYQYGYRRDVVWRLGKNSANITAFSTLVKSPFNYYAEISRDEKKMVIHFRPIENTFTGEVFRKVSGNKALDLSLKMSIDSKNILTSNLYWNPKVIEIVKTFIREMMKPDNIKSLMVDAYQSSENQLSSFTSNIKNNLVKSMNIPIGLEYVKGIVSDVERIPTAFAESYKEDDFYIKSALDSVYSALNKLNVVEKFTQSQNSMKEMVDSISKIIYEWCVEAKLYRLIYDQIYDKFSSITYSDIKIRIEMMVDTGKAIVSIFKSQITRIGEILEKLSERAESVSLFATKFNENFQSAFKGSTLSEMIELLREIRVKIIEGLGQVLETEFIKQRMLYYKESIQNTKEFIILAKEMTTRMMKYVKSSNVAGNILETINLIKSMKYKEAFMNMIKPEEAKFEMNLDTATMSMRLYVPPMIRPVLKMWKTASDWFPAQILSQMRGSGLGGKLLAAFYRYEYLVFNYGSLKSMRDLLPPFKKTAWVLGGNSILTYDGSSIRIGPGECTYLLARDTKYGSFSLIMRIKSDNKEKEFQLSYIDKVIVITPGMITVDGKTIKTLPYMISTKEKTVEIYRDYEIIKIKTSEGLVIKYFSSMDYLKFIVTGKWHGAVKGLLGSNDYDIHNDWSTPEGRITHDAGILSKSWSMDMCKSKTKTGLHSIKVDAKQLQECVNLFKPESLSYLERCFSLINPEPYFKLCQVNLQYHQMNDKDYEAFLCNLSRNYVIRCKAKGMMIRLKKSCVKCGKVKLSGDISEIKLKKNLKFNYIFIIEQSKCLLQYRSLVENLFEMMSLEKANIYTLLSFNGYSIYKEAHFKSLNHDISTDSSGFKSLLNDFISPLQLSAMPNLNTSKEGGQAIYNAIKMPSREGYIQKIIFISCSACDEHKKYIFSNLAGLLNNSGIYFNYLTTQQFTGLGSTADTVGLGNNLVYTFDKDNLKTQQWKKDLQPPTDVCSSLARLSDSFVWSLNAMNTEMRRRRVAETLHTDLRKASGNPKQKCSCGVGNYEEGKVACKVGGFR